MFYLVIFFFILFCSLCNLYSVRKSEIQLSNVMFYTVIFLLIIIGGFRFETGGDWPGYRALYDKVDTRAVEPLFAGVIGIAKTIGHYQWIFVICEIIRFVTMASFLRRNDGYDKRYKTMIILLYYVMYWFYYDLVIVRQATAAAIFIFGILRKSKIGFKEYLFYVLLATGFHFSSLFLIFMYYPLYKVSSNIVGKITLLFVLFYFVGLDIIPFLLDIVLNILPQTYFLYRLYAYTQIAELATNRVLTGQSFVYLLVFFVMLFNKYIMKKETNPLFYNGACMFIFLYFGFPSLSTISTRLSTYFSIFIIFEIVDIIKIYRKTIFVPVILVFLCFCFNKGVFFELPDKIAYNPYQFYWTHQIFDLPSDGLERLNSTPNYEKRGK